MLFLLSACTEGSVELLSGFEFGWEAFNHRLSHLEAQVEVADGAGFIEAAVVGGTSTTGVSPDLGETCDPDACQEFPFVDTADVVMTVTELSAPGLTWARGSATLRVGPDGASGPVTLIWATQPASFTPVITGFTLDTTGADSGCYDPSFGWLPTHLALSVEPDGTDARATAAFASGLSLEDERACLDEAASGAGATVTVDVLGIAGVEASIDTFSQAASWNEDGTEYAEQDVPNPDPMDLPDARAFQAFDFRFHVDDPEGRGAYLRTLTLDSAGLASATNYSPGTQLSGFDYAFAGTVVGFEGASSRDTPTELAYTPELDASGGVVPRRLEKSPVVTQ